MDCRPEGNVAFALCEDVTSSLTNNIVILIPQSPEKNLSLYLVFVREVASQRIYATASNELFALLVLPWSRSAVEPGVGPWCNAIDSAAGLSPALARVF
jgi:hypothetical protein